jgi:putative alpha-1,2-mannosidase
MTEVSERRSIRRRLLQLAGAAGGVLVQVRITAPQATPGTPYVQSLRLNGRVDQGAPLSFTLGGQPNTRWGAGAHATPPS